MSMTLMAQAMSIKVGNPIRKLVLIKLADNANDKGECWPSYQHIADQCEIGRSTVKSHIKALEDMGLVRREFRKNGLLNQSNLFYLTLNKPVKDIPKEIVASNKLVQMNRRKQTREVGQDLTGVGQDLTGGGAGADRGGGSGAAPITSHSFEPVTEPKNNTHTARSNFESVDNFATAPPPVCSDTQVQTGKGWKAGACLSSGPSAHGLITRCIRACHQTPRSPDAAVRIENQIAPRTGCSWLRLKQPACRSKHAADNPTEKFVMFEGWRPSPELSRTARKIGIELSGPPDQARLADFVTFWEADGAAYNQIQWEMKLARYLEKGRKKPAKKRTGERRGCTMVRNVDYAIPVGFRGE